jgi:hypothetical protein
VDGAKPAVRMSSIIFERNGVITAFLASSTEAETNFPALEAIPAIEASRDGDTAAYGEAVQSNQNYFNAIGLPLCAAILPLPLPHREHNAHSRDGDQPFQTMVITNSRRW